MIKYLFLLISLFISFYSFSSYAEPVESENTPILFQSLRTDKVNLRSGPGLHYPIEWVYKKKHFPVKVLAEFYNWKKIEDYQGTQGWIHRNLLSKKRTIIFKKKRTSLYKKANNQTEVRAYIEPNNIAEIIICDSGQCKVKVGSYKGWVVCKDIWGASSFDCQKKAISNKN